MPYDLAAVVKTACSVWIPALPEVFQEKVAGQLMAEHGRAASGLPSTSS